MKSILFRGDRFHHIEAESNLEELFIQDSREAAFTGRGDIGLRAWLGIDLLRLLGSLAAQSAVGNSTEVLAGATHTVTGAESGIGHSLVLLALHFLLQRINLLHIRGI